MAPMASVTMLMVMTLVMADIDLTSDMKELRGELEELRSEVRTQKAKKGVPECPTAGSSPLWTLT